MIGANLFLALKIVCYWFEKKSSGFSLSLSKDHHIDVLSSQHVFFSKEKEIQVCSFFSSNQATNRSGNNSNSIDGFFVQSYRWLFLFILLSVHLVLINSDMKLSFHFLSFFLLKSPLLSFPNKDLVFLQKMIVFNCFFHLK